MWTLKAADIAYLAALTAVVTFIRDRYVNHKERRKKAKLEPAQVDSIVLANARSAMELQSSVAATLRSELDARDRLLREQAAEMTEAKLELRKAEQREMNLLRRIGELDREVEILRRGGGKEGA